jgi:hypothetical protein
MDSQVAIRVKISRAVALHAALECDSKFTLYNTFLYNRGATKAGSLTFNFKQVKKPPSSPLGLARNKPNHINFMLRCEPRLQADCPL